jgi:CRP-like cAMP-binding protein
MPDNSILETLRSDPAVKSATYARGTVLFRQGDADGAVYIVASGAVGLYRESSTRRVPVATLRAGEMFGELAVTDGSSRQASAVTLEDSVVLIIPGDVLASKLAATDPFLKTLLAIFTANLRKVHDTYVPKSRSLLDGVNNLSRQYDVVAKFLLGDVSPAVRREFEDRLRALDGLVKDMRRLAMAHRRQDRRDDAIPHEADLPT